MKSPIEIDTKSNPLKIISTEKTILNWIDEKYEKLYENINDGKKFLSIYDKIDRTYPRTDFDLFDILITVSFNSRIDTAIKVESLYKVIPRFKKHCMSISGLNKGNYLHIHFKNNDPIVLLFLDMLYKDKPKFLGISTLSKIFHKKFPNLIPVLDSLFLKFYNKQYNLVTREKYQRFDIAEQSKYFVNLFNCIQKDIANNLELLNRLSKSIRASNSKLHLTNLRIWDLIIWDFMANNN